jgi:hypothetical protein
MGGGGIQSWMRDLERGVDDQAVVAHVEATPPLGLVSREPYSVGLLVNNLRFGVSTVGAGLSVVRLRRLGVLGAASSSGKGGGHRATIALTRAVILCTIDEETDEQVEEW